MADNRKPFLDPDHPFFAKPGRRWLAIIPALLAGILELAIGEWVWATAFLGLGLYALWVLVLNRKR